ncbi:MAG: hypothetical protein LBI36_00480 [Oscillospiraceae bacterium]|jgi:hypothetical protein|nr:hypothetical protein [Oscillospiraceae bacterium]
MIGYCVSPLKDFLLVEDEGNSRKIFDFDIQRDGTDWHSMEGGGFLFNTSVKNGNIQGFCVLITQSGLKLIEITGVSVDSFRNGYYAYVQNAGRLLNTYPITNLYAEHHFKIEVDKSTISLWDGNTLIIDGYELPDNDYGFGYGPITSHASHGCYQQSYFTFANITMETITGYYLKLDMVADMWGLTNSYWDETFTLTCIEYTPDENETITELGEHPAFANATDMLLFYPDGTYERIPWSNGSANYALSKRYIDVLKYNLGIETRTLEPGEYIVGAYSEQ